MLHTVAASWRRGAVPHLFLAQQAKQNVRTLAVYAVGEGWTGALGSGRLDEIIPGHNDEDLEEPENFSQEPLKPMYDDSAVQSIAVGWGHTAIVSQQHDLLVTGRPHDFSALLRLKRLPKWIRDYSVRQTLQSTVHDQEISEQVSKEGGSTRSSQGINIWDPTELVASLVSWLSDSLSPESQEWEAARQQSVLARLTMMDLHDETADEDYPVSVACSAGFSAYITNQGHLYTFGLNGYGQCAIGETTNNVWLPQRVTGLSSEFANIPRSEMEQTYPIAQVALGLQHGVCLNTNGEIFCWGKGERGQLGQETVLMESHTALPVKRTFSFAPVEDDDQDAIRNPKPIYAHIGKVVQVAAGMIHTAALTEDNRVLIWGKYVLPAFGDDIGRKAASDAVLPCALQGLPDGLKVEQIACGSHHTAMLLQDGSVWAVGVSADTKEPIHEPVELIPSGIVEMPVRQFAAHADRTTVVGCSGKQVLQVHLWKDPELREFAVFTPGWLDRLLRQNGEISIKEVHRSWIHSVVVTEPS